MEEPKSELDYADIYAWKIKGLPNNLAYLWTHAFPETQIVKSWQTEADARKALRASEQARGGAIVILYNAAFSNGKKLRFDLDELVQLATSLAKKEVPENLVNKILVEGEEHIERCGGG